ncbi:MAG: NRDE family protein [Phycisphaerales bacterium]|nr:NRDE family protein [Phycisphaerales bacterium]
MCTVSVMPVRWAARRGEAPLRGYRLVTNRDEQRDRPAAHPPRWHELGEGGVRALYPTDSRAGGTWIASTSAGLTLCLLNGNPRPYPALPPADRLLSRGAIIPGILARGLRAAAAVGDLAERMELEAFAPFTLLAVGLDHDRDGEVRIETLSWDGRSVVRRTRGGGPFCAVSSGLGDARVLPRLGLFDAMMAGPGSRREVQDRFHRHVWARRPEISVLMRRADASTVSITTIEVACAVDGSARLDMKYEAVGEAGSVLQESGGAGRACSGAAVVGLHPGCVERGGTVRGGVP